MDAAPGKETTVQFRKTTTAIAIAFAALTVGGQLAAAAPIDDKVADATKLQLRIEDNGLRLTALAEELNRAQIRLDESQRELRIAQANLNAAEEQAVGLRAALDGRAIVLIKEYAAGKTRAQDDVDLEALESAAQRAKYAQLTNDADRETYNKLLYVREDLTQKRKAVAAIEVERKTETEKIGKTKAALTKANAELQQQLDAVSTEIRELMLKENASQRDAAVSATRAGKGIVRDARPGTEPPNNTARVAIAFAMAQLGKPYVYAAAGPQTFDCSGLTMKAYAAAGVKMLHYSGYQYRDFPRVPLDALLPGDLVFWGENAKDHVGLYIGEGLMINAPHTGDVVKIAPVWNGVMGASRPWL